MKLMCIVEAPLAPKDIESFFTIYFFDNPPFSISDPMIKIVKLVGVLQHLIIYSNKIKMS
jgi:hypothetical protein